MEQDQLNAELQEAHGIQNRGFTKEKNGHGGPSSSSVPPSAPQYSEIETTDGFMPKYLTYSVQS